jgi:hypothetical protein
MTGPADQAFFEKPMTMTGLDDHSYGAPCTVNGPHCAVTGPVFELFSATDISDSHNLHNQQTHTYLVANLLSSLKMNASHKTITPECQPALFFELNHPPFLLRKKHRFEEPVSSAALPSSLLLPADFNKQSTSNDENILQFHLKPRRSRPSSETVLPADFSKQSTSNDEDILQFHLKPRRSRPLSETANNLQPVNVSLEFAATTPEKSSSSTQHHGPRMKRRRSSLCGSSVRDILSTPSHAQCA